MPSRGRRMLPEPLPHVVVHTTAPGKAVALHARECTTALATPPKAIRRNVLEQTGKRA